MHFQVRIRAQCIAGHEARAVALFEPPLGPAIVARAPRLFDERLDLGV
jgi:hypothetical protein